MNETQFSQAIRDKLHPYVGDCEVLTKKAVLYSLSFDDQGRLHLGINSQGEPVRGGGTGFEQDILVFERRDHANTSIIPRVIAEVKFDRVTTHDAIVYSEKARKIRGVYPFVRYGLILGDISNVPGRVLRLGQEFDFVIAFESRRLDSEFDTLGDVFVSEILASRAISESLFGSKRVKSIHRDLQIRFVD